MVKLMVRLIKLMVKMMVNSFSNLKFKRETLETRIDLLDQPPPADLPHHRFHRRLTGKECRAKRITALSLCRPAGEIGSASRSAEPSNVIQSPRDNVQLGASHLESGASQFQQLHDIPLP